MTLLPHFHYQKPWDYNGWKVDLFLEMPSSFRGMRKTTNGLAVRNRKLGVKEKIMTVRSNMFITLLILSVLLACEIFFFSNRA